MDRKERICAKCKKDKGVEVVEDEEHVLSNCTNMEVQRQILRFNIFKTLIEEKVVDIDEMMNWDADCSDVFQLLPMLHQIRNRQKTYRHWEAVGFYLEMELQKRKYNLKRKRKNETKPRKLWEETHKNGPYTWNK